MKKNASVIWLLIFMLPLLSFDYGSLLNHPIPLLPNKTLDGKTIDENYFRGHVTIVSFMYIGCPGCMNEITPLNKLKQEYAGNDKVQILCVARNMKEQMVQFNSNDTAKPDTNNLQNIGYGLIRKAMKADAIQYTIQPACNEGHGRTVNGNEIRIASECNTIKDVYGIETFPTTFFVDKKGIVREMHVGGPAIKDDEEFYNYYKKQVDSLLAE